MRPVIKKPSASPRRRLIAAQNAAIDRLVMVETAHRSAAGADLAQEILYRTADGLIHLAKFRALMLTQRIRRASARPWENDIKDVAADCAAIKLRAVRELALAIGYLEAAEAALSASRRRRDKSIASQPRWRMTRVQGERDHLLGCPDLRQHDWTPATP